MYEALQHLEHCSRCDLKLVEQASLHTVETLAGMFVGALSTGPACNYNRSKGTSTHNFFYVALGLAARATVRSSPSPLGFSWFITLSTDRGLDKPRTLLIATMDMDYGIGIKKAQRVKSKYLHQ